MGLTAKILGRCRVLVVSFTGASVYGLRLVAAGQDHTVTLPDIGAVRSHVGKSPLILVACGYGVISKAVTADLEAKITAQGGEFLWRRDRNALCFVRRAQLEPFADLQPLAVTCAVSPDDAHKVAAECYAQHVNLRNLLKPSPLASLLASRVQLPILAALLLALAVNAAVLPGVNGRWQTAQTEKEALEKQIGKADDASKSRAKALAEWGRALPRSYAWLCDRAASTLPEGVTLSSLSVQPLLKAIEDGRTPMFSEREMVISGHTPRSESVSEYTAALSGLKISRQVKLSAVEYDREKGRYNFRINIEL